jgi:hypothetical protein
LNEIINKNALLKTSQLNPIVIWATSQQMDKENIIEQYEAFQSKRKIRQRIRISLDAKFEAILDVMEYVILSKF